MLYNKIKIVLRPQQLLGNILAYFVVASLTNQYNFIALALVRKHSSLFCNSIIVRSIKSYRIDTCKNTLAYFVRALFTTQYNFIAWMLVRKTIAYFVAAPLELSTVL